jgi:small-conductance mechanosensitive channel
MADIWTELSLHLEPYMGIIRIIVVIIIAIIVFSLISRLIKRILLKKIKTKKHVSNVSTFIDLLRYLFIIFLLIIVFSTYYGRWSDFGFIAGLLTVALGWALQKPISGVVAWLILTIKRPIHIGDRVIISNTKGDITDITLTHIFLDEVGGTIIGEEKSGRTVMLPTSIIFEEEIINYTHQDDYILDEVTTAITYESDLKKAEELIIKSVEKIMKPIWKKFPKRITREVHNRLLFKDSGIDITVRYFTIVTNRNQISTDIRREIFNQIRNTKEVEIAYPHTEVLFREKQKRRN